jgi:phospholipid/cholesterol/gamma-HCH transport system substrate-binding protein
MEQQSLSLQYKVGLFIGLGLFAVMVSVLVLGGDKVLFTRYIEIHTHFDEVQGLFPGSIVSLAGVPVGNIKAIEFVPTENKLDVVMKINSVYHARLVEGTAAEVRTQGALGDKYIYLTPGSPGGKVIHNRAVIEGVDTDYMKLLTDRENGVARVIDLIKEMQTLVANLNANGRSAEMMRNMTEASSTMKKTMASFDQLLNDLHGNIPENKKLKSALISFANILEKIDQGKGTLGQLINDPSVHQSLKTYLGGSPRNRYMKDMIRETIQKSDSKP